MLLLGKLRKEIDMKRLIVIVCLCMGIQSEPGVSMMDVDSSPTQHKKIISKGFKPSSSIHKETSTFSKKQTSFDEEILLYDDQRDMYYYGKNLSEAAQKKDEAIPSSEVIDPNGIIALQENK